MSPLVFAGAGIGLGLFVAGRGLLVRPRPLVNTMQRLDRTGVSVADRRAAPQGSITRDLTGAAVHLVRGHLGSRTERDLAVMERSVDRFVVEKFTTTLAMLTIAVALGVTLQLVGAPLAGIAVFVLVFGATAVGFVVPDLTLRSHAKARRAGFRHALSSYLDLVNILLAGGAGIETSLEAAAQAGDGWAFIQIRHALVRSRTMRQSPWTCFSELGDQLGVRELAEIAASVRLAGEQGARVKLSLSAKAAALRAHQMARIEADAHAATERMGLPTVLMFVGFMVLLGYPAMQQIVRAL
jgi:Flp pilus assembly protein TadB